MTKKATPRLTKLLNRIERICLNKSALARALGVSPTHIKKWLTARVYEPGGEVTLAMLEWVQAEEAKPKTESPGGALTPPEPKTQVRKSGHEKQTQVRKKR